MSAKLMNILSRISAIKTGSCLLKPARQFHSSLPTQTLILERWWDVPLPKTGRPPRMRRRHNVYKVVSSESGPKELSVILTKDSLEFGVTGEVLTLDKHVARSLISKFRAIYASPENLSEMASLTSGRSQQSSTGRRMLLWLRTMKSLKCPLRPNVDWTLSPEIVCRALYRAHRLVVSPNALKLPDYPISSSDEDTWGQHEIEITVNEIDTVKLKMDIIPWTSNDGKS